MKMKVQFPDGMTSASVDGTNYKADKEGQCVVSSAHMADLACFGVTPLKTLPELDDAEVAAIERDKKLNAILEGNVGEVTNELEGLDDAELVRIGELEAAEGNRKGVAAAIEAITAERAAAGQ